MSIQKVKENYENRTISKAVFIDKMKEFHKVLFDFSESLKDTEINKIEILDNEVIMETRKTDYHNGGIKLIVDKLDKRTVTLEAFNFNTYEKEDSEMIYNLIDSKGSIIDIGANVGWYSLHFAAMLNVENVYSFEPIPETYKKLQKNISINNLKNIKSYPIALSEKKQKLPFYYSPMQTGASSSKNILENEDAIQLELESITLDEFVKNNNIEQIDFIKCDVEGAELFVFQGALNSIKKFKPIIFTETLRKWAAKFNYHPNDIFDFFVKLDYEAYYVKNKKLIKIDRVTEDTEQTNFFLLHKEKHFNTLKKFII